MSTEQNTERVQTNGHDHGGANGKPLRPTPAVKWLPAADLPDHLSGAVIPTPPTEDVDETPIWGDDTRMPDPDALERAVERARRTVDLQAAPELAEAKSPADLAADLDSRRRVRDDERVVGEEEARARVAERRAEIAHRAGMAKLEREHAAAITRARFQAEKVANPWHEVVRVARGSWWVPLAGFIPAVFALILGAVNIGIQLRRIFPDIPPAVVWLVDPMVTLLIIAISGAHYYGASRNNANKNVFAWIEGAAFLLTSVAAVGLHYVPTPASTSTDSATPAPVHDPGVEPLFWLCVPVMLGLSMAAAPLLRERMVSRLNEAHEAARRGRPETVGMSANEGGGESLPGVCPTPSDLHGENPGEGSGANPGEGVGERSGEVVPDPDRESLDSIRERLRKLAAAGEVDPHRVSVNAARKALGVRPERAEEALIAEYGRPDLVERRRRREEKKKRS